MAEGNENLDSALLNLQNTVSDLKRAKKRGVRGDDNSDTRTLAANPLNLNADQIRALRDLYSILEAITAGADEDDEKKLAALVKVAVELLRDSNSKAKAENEVSKAKAEDGAAGMSREQITKPSPSPLY